MRRPLLQAARKSIEFELRTIGSLQSLPKTVLGKVKQRLTWSQEEYEEAEHARDTVLGDAALADNNWRYDEERAHSDAPAREKPRRVPNPRR